MKLSHVLTLCGLIATGSWAIAITIAFGSQRFQVQENEQRIEVNRDDIITIKSDLRYLVTSMDKLLNQR